MTSSRSSAWPSSSPSSSPSHYHPQTQQHAAQLAYAANQQQQQQHAYNYQPNYSDHHHQPPSPSIPSYIPPSYDNNSHYNSSNNPSSLLSSPTSQYMNSDNNNNTSTQSQSHHTPHASRNSYAPSSTTNTSLPSITSSAATASPIASQPAYNNINNNYRPTNSYGEYQPTHNNNDANNSMTATHHPSRSFDFASVLPRYDSSSNNDARYNTRMNGSTVRGRDEYNNASSSNMKSHDSRNNNNNNNISQNHNYDMAPPSTERYHSESYARPSSLQRPSSNYDRDRERDREQFRISSEYFPAVSRDNSLESQDSMTSSSQTPQVSRDISTDSSYSTHARYEPLQHTPSNSNYLHLPRPATQSNARSIPSINNNSNSNNNNNNPSSVPSYNNKPALNSPHYQPSPPSQPPPSTASNNQRQYEQPASSPTNASTGANGAMPKIYASKMQQLLHLQSFLCSHFCTLLSRSLLASNPTSNVASIPALQSLILNSDLKCSQVLIHLQVLDSINRQFQHVLPTDQFDSTRKYNGVESRYQVEESLDELVPILIVLDGQMTLDEATEHHKSHPFFRNSIHRVRLLPPARLIDIIYAYLTAPTCRLFNSRSSSSNIGNFTQGDEHYLTSILRQESFNPQVDITREQVEAMVKSQKHEPENIILHLWELDQQARRFNSLNALINAIHTRSYLYTLLAHPPSADTAVLEPLVAYTVTGLDISNLLKAYRTAREGRGIDSQEKGDTMMNEIREEMKAMYQDGGYFESFQELTVALQAHVYFPLADRLQLWSLLTSTNQPSFLFSTPAEPPTLHDVNLLVVELKAGPIIMDHIMRFKAVGQRLYEESGGRVHGCFRQWDDLKHALGRVMEQAGKQPAQNHPQQPPPVKKQASTPLGYVPPALNRPPSSTPVILQSPGPTHMHGRAGSEYRPPSRPLSRMSSANAAQPPTSADDPQFQAKRLYIHEFLTANPPNLFYLPQPCSLAQVDQLVVACRHNIDFCWEQLCLLYEAGNKFDNTTHLLTIMQRIMASTPIMPSQSTTPRADSVSFPSLAPRDRPGFSQQASASSYMSESNNISGTTTPRDKNSSRTPRTPKGSKRTSIATDFEIRSQIFTFLNKPDCPIWKRGAHARVTAVDLVGLVKVAKTAADLQMILGELERQGAKFQTPHELSFGILKFVRTQLRDKGAAGGAGY